MVSISPPATESRHASWWQLCLVFVLALLLFVGMRWQPEPWLQHQIDQQLRHSGIDLQYQALHVDGLTVRMEHVSIRVPELPAPVVLDSLYISPAWSSLLTGAAAVDVKATLFGQPAEAVLVWQNEYIGLHGLSAEFEVAALAPLWKQRMTLPVDITGILKLSGNMQLDAVSGMPVDGQINAIWQQAGIDLPMFDKALGDYQLALSSADSATGKWQWELSGGTEVTLSGSGQLDLSGALPQQWMVSGRAQLQASPEAKTIAAMLGGQAKAFNISGNLLNVRIQTLPH